jgi:phosphoglucomutase
MTLDTDGKIRMDCSSPNAMASLIRNKDEYDMPRATTLMPTGMASSHPTQA